MATAGERTGVAAAVLSSALGGTAAAITRYVIGATDPVTLAAFRFGIGFLLILPIALALRSRWPQGRDWAGVALLGVFFFTLFFVIYNVAMSHTTAARGSLALCTLPLVTMVVAALLGREALTARKTLGVVIAVGGVAIALATGLAGAPAGAWRGDLIDGGGHAVHGLLQCVVAAVHGAIEPARVPGGGDGFRRRVQHAHRLAERRPRRGRAGVRPGAVGGGDRRSACSAARRRFTSGCSPCSARRRRASRTR